ncbi:MAG: hypothetical protein KAT00_11750, partial [Planctomycetes bacterium]|nr:hypothetical protein [Planctomycetota bacterium]
MKHSKLILLICVVVAAVILWQVCFRDVWPFVGLAGDKSVAAAQADPADKPDADQKPAIAVASESGPADSGYDMTSKKPDKSYADYGDKSGEDKFDDSEMRDAMQSLGLGDGLFDSGGYYWSGDPNELDESYISSGPREPSEPMESVNLNNVEMRSIVRTIGDWTGKPIIPMGDEVMDQRITIYASKELPRSKALSLIYAALRAKGVVVEQLDDKIFLKPLAQARLGAVPTLGPADPLARIADKSQIVEKFFVLQSYSPTDLAGIISPLTAEYGHVTALEDTSHIVVIDTVESLMRIERIIAQLDVPESDQEEERIFDIMYGDPAEIVQVLELIIGATRSSDRRYDPRSRDYRPSGSSSSGKPSPPSKSSKPTSKSSGTATSVVVGQANIEIRLIPVPKQNWIIARASIEDMEEIAYWIDRLDRYETVEAEQTMVKVNHLDVQSVLDIIEAALEDMPGYDFETNVVVEGLSESKQIVIFGSEENRKMIEKMIAQIDLPIDDIYVERTFDLDHADPDQIKEHIETLYAEDAMTSMANMRYSYSYTKRAPAPSEDLVKVISYPMLNQVTVIASEENMIKIANQIIAWDVPLDVDRDQYRIIVLRNSDPVLMAELLSKLFSEDSESSSGSFMRYIFGRGSDSDTKNKIVGPLYGLLTFEPIPDTKKLIVISKVPEAYDVIERLVLDLDGQEMAEVPKVITLKYADAEDLCDQLNAILNEPGTQATIQRSTRGLSAYEVDAQGNATSSSDEESSAGEIRPWWDQQRTTGDEMPTSNLIGKIRFIPVHRSKAILVLAPPEYLEAIGQMIDELDQPGKQVMIKVVIVEIDHSNMTSLGVQLASNSSAFGMLEENELTALNILTNTQDFGGMLQLTTAANINVLVDLLMKKANAKILNQPTLWTKDNEEATFVKGQNVAFKTAEQTELKSGSSSALTSTFEYRDVGVTLRVRPNITPERAVDMSINLIISQVSTDDVNGEIATNKLDTTTHVIVNDGETILLGGILFQTDSI